jgi:hypothetical protein
LIGSYNSALSSISSPSTHNAFSPRGPPLSPTYFCPSIPQYITHNHLPTQYNTINGTPFSTSSEHELLLLTAAKASLPPHFTRYIYTNKISPEAMSRKKDKQSSPLGQPAAFTLSYSSAFSKAIISTLGGLGLSSFFLAFIHL